MKITATSDSERLAAACMLSIVGGFLDIYTFLCRGHVFANAVTGNMVLFGLSLAECRWKLSGHYLITIFSYACGVYSANVIHRRLSPSRRLSWNQSVVLLEVLCLFPLYFIPSGSLDFVVNSVIAFVCALQVQTFRRVNGLPFASTMCTGNLRSGTDALYKGFGGDRREFGKALHYYGVIAFFISGAVLGALLIRNFGPRVFFLAPVGLLVVFFLITTKRRLVVWRRLLRLRR